MKTTRIRLLFIFLIAAAFYFYDPAVRATPSVMTTQLMSGFGLSAVGIGFIAAFYLYAYNITQIPAGLMGDKIGARHLLILSCLLLGFGALGFAHAGSYSALLFFRFVMGLGGASSTVCALLIINEWFPARWFAFLAGIIQLFGSLGNMFTDVPVARSVHHVGWRFTMSWLAVIGIVIAVVAYFILPRKKHNPPANDQPIVKTPVLRPFFKVIRSRLNWSVISYSFFLWIPVTAFAGLWGIPYMTLRYHTSTADGALLFTAFWLGAAVGNPLIGLWSDKIKKRVMPLAASALIGLIAILIILFMPAIQYQVMFLLLFCLGLASSGQILSFALIKEYNTGAVIGTAMALNNLAVMLGGDIVDPLIGAFLKLGWHGKMHHHAPVYSLVSYQHAFYLLPCFYLLALVSCRFLLKETHCSPLPSLPKDDLICLNTEQRAC